jgi:CheY-like chemotaxis protein
MRHHGTKVLVVDDDPEWIELMKDILENDGYAVAAAENGVVALEQLSRFHPFIVITDLHMPLLDGRELLAKVRAQDERVPVIVVTADRERVSAGLAGAFRVVGKLSEVEGVLSAVADATAHRVAHLPLQKLWNAVNRRSRPAAAALAAPNCKASFGRRRRRGSGVVSSTLSRLSSSSFRRRVLLTAVVVSSLVLLVQLTARLTQTT